jgi:hypothetical protein
MTRRCSSALRPPHRAGRGDRAQVTPNPEGGWDAKAAGAKRASSHHRTQAQAEAAAKGYAANQGGGEVRIHGRGGAIRDSDTVPRARDPNPPRDKRH